MCEENDKKAHTNETTAGDEHFTRSRWKTVREARNRRKRSSLRRRLSIHSRKTDDNGQMCSRKSISHTLMLLGYCSIIWDIYFYRVHFSSASTFSLALVFRAHSCIHHTLLTASRSSQFVVNYRDPISSCPNVFRTSGSVDFSYERLNPVWNEILLSVSKNHCESVREVKETDVLQPSRQFWLDPVLFFP